MPNMRIRRWPPRGVASSEAGVLVVIVILVSLVVFAFVQHQKSSDIGEADLAKTMVGQISGANRMRTLDGKPYATGAVTNASPLVAEHYLITQDWAGYDYAYEGANDPSQPTYVARAYRKKSAPKAPDSDLVYCADRNGQTRTGQRACGSPP